LCSVLGCLSRGSVASVFGFFHMICYCVRVVCYAFCVFSLRCLSPRSPYLSFFFLTSRVPRALPLLPPPPPFPFIKRLTLSPPPPPTHTHTYTHTMLPNFLSQERAWVQGYLISSLHVLQYRSSSVGTYPKLTLEIHISSCMFNQVCHRVKIVMIKCPVYGSPLIERKKQT